MLFLGHPRWSRPKREPKIYFITLKRRRQQRRSCSAAQKVSERRPSACLTRRDPNCPAQDCFGFRHLFGGGQRSAECSQHCPVFWPFRCLMAAQCCRFGIRFFRAHWVIAFLIKFAQPKVTFGIGVFPGQCLLNDGDFCQQVALV